MAKLIKRFCEVCGAEFPVPTHGRYRDMRYCSSRCRNTAKVRRQRDRAKAQ